MNKLFMEELRNNLNILFKFLDIIYISREMFPKYIDEYDKLLNDIFDNIFVYKKDINTISDIGIIFKKGITVEDSILGINEKLLEGKKGFREFLMKYIVITIKADLDKTYDTTDKLMKKIVFKTLENNEYDIIFTYDNKDNFDRPLLFDEFIKIIGKEFNNVTLFENPYNDDELEVREDVTIQTIYDNMIYPVLIKDFKESLIKQIEDRINNSY